MMKMETKRARVMAIVEMVLADKQVKVTEAEGTVEVFYGHVKSYNVDYLINRSETFNAKKIADELVREILADKSAAEEAEAETEVKAESWDNLTVAEKREEVVAALFSRGHNAKVVKYIKNGREVCAVSVEVGKGSQDGESVFANIQIDHYLEAGEQLEPILGKIERSLAEGAEEFNPFELTKCLKTKEWSLERLSIVVERKADNPIANYPIKEGPFEKTVQFLCVVDDAGHRAKVSYGMLSLWKVPEDEAWKIAMTHIRSHFKIEPMMRFMQSKGMMPMGIPIPDEDEEMMFLIGVDGNCAADALNIDLLREKFANRTNTIAIIPASIYECIVVIPEPGCPFDEDELDSMVRDVNTEHVVDCEQLSDKALVVNF